MVRIEGHIKKFLEDSLLGSSREVINDSFSEVTTTLEAISNDLAQTKLLIEDGEENGQTGNPPSKKRNERVN